jgi:hypothetical protein
MLMCTNEKNTIVCRAGSLLPGGERRGCILVFDEEDVRVGSKNI